MKKVWKKIVMIICILCSAILLPNSLEASELDSLVCEESTVSESSAARTVPHYTFSGTPGQPGTGANGDVWDGTYYHLSDGTLATECFFCDGISTYYLQNDGTPMKERLTYHPDGEHIIYFDFEGKEVFNSPQLVTKSITGEEIKAQYYFDVYGFMYIDELTFLNQQPVFFNYDGKRLVETMYTFPNGDRIIANYEGNLESNRFTYDAFGRIVYCNWNGVIAKGQVSDGNYCYNMDAEDGHLIDYYPVDGKQSDSPPFPGLQNKLDQYNISHGGECAYDMRLIGDNAITNSIADWCSDESVLTYMDEAVDDQFWRLSIYKDSNGKEVDSFTQKEGSYSTIRGITLGMDRLLVRERYGAPRYEKDNWDWYTISYRENRYFTSWLEAYWSSICGIRFYYDENDCVSQIVYQRYPIISNLADTVIGNDIQDFSEYYVKRDIQRYSRNVETVHLDVSNSKYYVEGSSFQWYYVGGNLTIDPSENLKIDGATTKELSFDPKEYNMTIYCRITTPEGTQYDVIYLSED